MAEEMNTSTTRRQKPSPACAISVVAGMLFVALVVMVAVSRGSYVFDEPIYMAGPAMLRAGASFHTFLLAKLDTPAGPLYAVLHWLLSPLTGLRPPYVRFVNIVLLAAMIGALAGIVRLWGFDRVGARAGMILAVPAMLVTAGMALTEIPAVTMVTFSVLCAAWSMRAPFGNHRRIWVGFLLSGLLFGIGVLGRQPFLPAVVGFAAIAIFERRLRFPACAAALLAIAVPFPVFAVWHGLVPPDTRFVGAGVNVEYGALGYAYASIFMLLLAPRYYAQNLRATFGVCAIGAIISLIAGGLSIQVAAGVARHFPPVLGALFQAGVSALMVATGAAFIASSALNLWEKRDDHLFVLLVLLSVGLVTTPALVTHQFSSRYLMMTFPYLFLVAQPYYRFSWWAVLRLGVAGVFGLASLNAYFQA